ncbi:hypothetical protein LQZ19_00120 [Treponema primitia]|uniref:hypothetical protein n=1 Tax=Treponema primitia TaxID=88058 RepID=UPI003980E5A7
MMKPIRFIAVLLLIFPLSAGAQTFSGILDSKLTLGAGAGNASDFLYGFEEYANIRMQAKVKDRGAFYGALNLIAASGASSQGSMDAGENYAAYIELERLYFRLNGESVGLDAGLMRLPFGYGQAWGSSDFLNPRSPLSTTARPRAILGAACSLYPADSAKLLVFTASPRNPFEQDGGGLIAGLSAENHWGRASLQALYAYETPVLSSSGIHRWGLSVKADLIVGLVADALYAWNPNAAAGIDGLSAGAGFDYSFLDGDCYVLTEYLYNGSDSSTASGIFALQQQNYLYALFRYRFNDYTSASLACAAALDDLSFSPTLSMDYEIFQGMSLSISAQVPLDKAVLADSSPGELGPERTGTRLLVTALVRLRF